MKRFIGSEQVHFLPKGIYKKLKENADIQEYWLAVAIFAKEPFEFWNAPYTIPCDIGYSRIFLIQYDGIRELKS